MKKQTVLLVVTVTLVVGVAVVVAAHRDRPQLTSSISIVAIPMEKLCPKPSGEEEAGPQGRLVRAGCLENFVFFDAERGGGRVSPPAALPAVVRGWHHLLKQHVEIHVESRKTDACIKDHEGRSIDAPPLYDVWVDTPDGRLNLCGDATYEPMSQRCPSEAEDLKGRAVAVPGYWDQRGNHRAEVQGKSVFTLACTSGAAAKCVHWGYVPWASYPGPSGAPLEPYHAACVRAARAQYLDNDRSFTCDMTTIDTFDQLGIRRPEDSLARNAHFAFEAAWGAEGLVRLSRTRYAGCEGEITSKLPKEKYDPRYDPNGGWPPGALIMNRSQVGRTSPTGLCPSSADRCSPRTEAGMADSRPAAR